MSFPYFLKDVFYSYLEETNKRLTEHDEKNYISVIKEESNKKPVNVNGSIIHILHLDIELQFNMISLDAYKVIGFMRQEENSINYSDDIIKHHNSFRCEHCETSRSRKSVFILENVFTKKQVTIGKNCVNAFTGKNIETLLLNFFLFKERTELLLNNYINEYVIYYNLLIQAVYDCYKENKRYIKCNDISSTMSKVTSRLNKYLKINDQEVEDIKQRLIKRFRNIDINEYALNSVVYKSLFDESRQFRETFTPSMVGSVSWAIFTCLNNENVEEEQNTSKYLEKIACKITKDVIIKKISSVESKYGTLQLMVMQDSDGNVMSTFTTAKWCYEVKEKQSIKISGIIKEHKIFDNIKTTVLKNVKKE